MNTVIDSDTSIFNKSKVTPARQSRNQDLSFDTYNYGNMRLFKELSKTKHKRHQEDNMNKQKAALDLIRKKTEMSKIKALQKFSSNIRYSDNDPELGQYYSESYRN